MKPPHLTVGDLDQQTWRSTQLKSAVVFCRMLLGINALNQHALDVHRTLTTAQRRKFSLRIAIEAEEVELTSDSWAKRDQVSRQFCFTLPWASWGAVLSRKSSKVSD
jgi:hypothetical protein